MEKTRDNFLLPEKVEYEGAWIAIGYIVMFLTLMAGFFFFYANFFERTIYLRRKYLLKYMQENDIDFPEKHDWNSILGINYSELRLVYVFNIDDDYRINLWNDKRWSLHHIKPCECILSPFNTAVQDKITYYKIRKILLDKVKEGEKLGLYDKRS